MLRFTMVFVRCAFLAAVLTAVAISLPGSRSGDAAFPGANGKIAFSSDRAFLGADIYTMNPDGSGVSSLTSGGGQVPAWSADGTKIAFRDGSVAGDIWIMGAAGGAQTNLTNTPDGETGPDSSPDGTKIVFVRNGDIYVMNANGTGQTNLTNTLDGEASPDWSPDGTKIVFVRNGDIYVMNAGGSGQAGLTNDPLLEEEPAWSPDGTKIAFTRGSFAPEVYVMNADGSGQTNISNNPGSSDRAPDWQPLPPAATPSPTPSPTPVPVGGIAGLAAGSPDPAAGVSDRS